MKGKKIQQQRQTQPMRDIQRLSVVDSSNCRAGIPLMNKKFALSIINDGKGIFKILILYNIVKVVV